MGCILTTNGLHNVYRAQRTANIPALLGETPDYDGRTTRNRRRPPARHRRRREGEA